MIAITTVSAAAAPSTVRPTRSADWEMVFWFQPGFRAPNCSSSCENVKLRFATRPFALPVPFTVTVKTLNR